jgi:hypothetical protein
MEILDTGQQQGNPLLAQDLPNGVLNLPEVLGQAFLVLVGRVMAVPPPERSVVPIERVWSFLLPSPPFCSRNSRRLGGSPIGSISVIPSRKAS